MTKLTKRVISFLAAAGMVLTLPVSALAEPDAEKQIEEGNLLLMDQQDNEALEQEIQNGNILMYSGAPENIGDESFSTEETTDPTATGTGEDDGETPLNEDDDPYLDPDFTGETDAPVETDTAEQPTGTANVTGSDVKIRAEANTESEILFYLPNGVQVDVLAQAEDWYKVRYGIVEGFVYNQYLFINTDDGRNGIIMEDGVNLRNEPNTESEALAKMEVGSVVKVIGYEEAWYKVESDDKTGYVNRDYIRVSGKYSSEGATRIIAEEMSGAEVKKIQEELKKRGFFIGETTEDFGSKTKQALMDFQKAANVEQDGIAGQATMDLLFGDNNIVRTISDAAQVKGLVKLTPWDEVNKIIGRGEVFKVIDVNTGITWKERRMGGWYHIDTEPLTAQDSANMKKAYGGTWSWDRRAVWVVYGNQVFAASMNGMPHLGSTIGGNNFNGHHCIHFYKSKVHANSKQCPRHQAKVQEAYAQGN